MQTTRLHLAALLLAVSTASSAVAQEAIAEAVTEPTPAPAQANTESDASIDLEGSSSEELAMAEPERKLRPLTVAVSLMGDNTMNGTLLDSTSIPMKTAFGEATIPLSEVAGIRFPGSGDNGTTIVMMNGDSITGATDLKFVTVETSWGSAKINGQSIASLLFVPGLAWKSSDSIGGTRWSLVEATAVEASQVQTASGTMSSNGTFESPGSSSNLSPVRSGMQGSSIPGSGIQRGSSSSLPQPQSYSSPRVIYGNGN